MATRKRNKKNTTDQALNFQEKTPAPETPAPEIEKPPEMDEAQAQAVKKAAEFTVPPAQEGGAPAWVKIPSGFVFPRGKQFLFVRFKSSWTDTPLKGEPVMDPETGEVEADLIPYTDDDGNMAVRKEPILYRQCICIPLNVADKKFAIGRSQGDANRMVDELTKQMIRACDGAEADWAMGAGPHDIFWNEIGEKCRALLTRMFNKLHILPMEETQDFLQRCVVVRSST